MTAAQTDLNFDDPLAGLALSPVARFVGEVLCRATGKAPVLIRQIETRAITQFPRGLTERKIKAAIEELRLAGLAIVSRRNAKPDAPAVGSFLARTDEELQEFEATYGSQVFQMLRVYWRVKKANGRRFTGQQEFADLLREIQAAL
jgi:hypothetical protein